MHQYGPTPDIITTEAHFCQQKIFRASELSCVFYLFQCCALYFPRLSRWLVSSSFSQCVASSSLRQPSAGQPTTLFDYSPSVWMKKTLNTQSLGLFSVIIPQEDSQILLCIFFLQREKPRFIPKKNCTQGVGQLLEITIQACPLFQGLLRKLKVFKMSL